MNTILNIEDCVYLIARSLGASHIKRQTRERWTAIKVTGDEVLTCGIFYTNIPGELFTVVNWRKGKMPAVTTILRPDSG